MIRKCGLAQLSFVLALVLAVSSGVAMLGGSSCAFELVASPLGMVTALVAVVSLIRISLSSGKLTGYRLAGSALILAVVCFPLYAAGFLEARRKSHGRACIANMREIHSAYQQYTIEHTNGPALKTVSDLMPAYVKGKEEPKCPRGGGRPYILTNATVVCPVVQKHPDHVL